MTSHRKRALKIVRILRKSYPKTKTALYHRTPLQILIATILSAQCTDERVNKITPGLFRKYRSPYDFSKARQSILEKEIRSTGFYRNKAKNIIASCKIIVRDFKGKVPGSMEDLISLPGVARKTANIVLSVSFKKAEGIAVDTHVKRLSRRLGLTMENNPEKIEKDLMKILPKRYWLDFNFILVDHGRKICKARRPLCKGCVVSGLCPSLGVSFPS